MSYNDQQMTTIETQGKFRKQLLVYTALFAITAAGVFFVFLFFGRTFLHDMDGNIDGIGQQYPIYTKIKHMIEALIAGQGFSVWTWDIGLGDDSFIEFNGKLLNPLTYICIAFPYKYLDIGYCLMTVVSQYLTGVTFMVFLRGVGIRDKRVVLGGVCYAFSGWIIYAMIRQCSFTTVTILLPLIILGIDKILRKESPALFIISVALHLLYGVLWAYIDAIIVFIYFILRYFWYNKGEKSSTFFKTFFAFAGYGVIGVLISSAVIIQNLLKYGNATISSTVESYLFYTIRDYLTYPLGFFELNTVQEPYSVITLPIVCIVLLPMLIPGIRQRSTAAILAVFFFLASLIPITGSILNGMSYSVGRWFYVLVFFMVWACMEQATEETFASVTKRRIMAIWILLLGIWNVGCYMLLDIIGRNAVLCTFIGVVLGLITVLLFRANAKGKKYSWVAIVLIAMVSAIGYSNMLFFPHFGDYIYNLDMVGKAKEKLDSSTQRIVQELQKEDTSFYRTDQVDGYTDARIARVRANENLYFGNRSIYTYFSSMNSGWHKYNKILGNNAGYFDRTTSFSNDNRAGMDFLMGVKYFLGDSESLKPGATEYAPYGFNYYETIDGVEVLKSQYCIGLGTAYGQYITESELMDYPELEREQVIMQAAVVPDEAVSKIEGVKHAQSGDIKTGMETVDYQLENGTRAEVKDATGNTPGTIVIQEDEEGVGGHFTIRIPRVKNAQLVFVFDDLLREKCDYVEAEELTDSEYSDSQIDTITEQINADSFKDNQKFEVLLTYGNIQKAAQCRKGKNQGFSDVEDYYINLGYFDSVEGDVDVYIDRLGNYTFKDLTIYAVPMDLIEENEKILQDSCYNIETYEGDTVKGTFDIDQDSIMYFSIIDTPGWDIYVDGEKADKINSVNITFTGAEITAGHHEVIMKYHTPGIQIGCALTACGIILLIIISVMYIRRKKRSEREEQ